MKYYACEPLSCQSDPNPPLFSFPECTERHSVGCERWRHSMQFPPGHRPGPAQPEPFQPEPKLLPVYGSRESRKRWDDEGWGVCWYRNHLNRLGPWHPWESHQHPIWQEQRLIYSARPGLLTPISGVNESLAKQSLSNTAAVMNSFAPCLCDPHCDYCWLRLPPAAVFFFLFFFGLCCWHQL